MGSPDPNALVLLFKGDDPILLGDAVRDAVRSLVGDGDRSLIVDELTEARYELDGGGVTAGPIVDAAQTPPFLTDKRVVVARHMGVFKSGDLDPVIAYLADPLSTTSLVLAWERGTATGATVGVVPKKLVEAITRAGGSIVSTGAGYRANERSSWVDDQLRLSEVRFDSQASQRITEHLGEDVGRLPALLATLVGVYGEGAQLGLAEVEPYLLADGGVAPWELTDSLDKGDVQSALSALHRMMGAGGRHPIQVMATLTGHYTRMLALDGAQVSGEKDAAQLLGLKGSTFPAKKALSQCRRLGPARLHEFVGLLAEADLDLRGMKAWPDELVMEVLVARLASRSKR